MKYIEYYPPLSNSQRKMSDIPTTVLTPVPAAVPNFADPQNLQPKFPLLMDAANAARKKFVGYDVKMFEEILATAKVCDRGLIFEKPEAHFVNTLKDLYGFKRILKLYGDHYIFVIESSTPADASQARKDAISVMIAAANAKRDELEATRDDVIREKVMTAMAGIGENILFQVPGIIKEEISDILRVEITAADLTIFEGDTKWLLIRLNI